VARSPTWAIGSQTKLWATFCVDRRSHPRRSRVGRPPARWHRLLHGRSADLARLITYYMLFFIEIGSRLGVAGRHFDRPESARAGTTRSSVLHGYATCHETACRIRIARQNVLENQAISLRTEFFAEHSARSANPQCVYRICPEQHRTGRCNLRSMPRIYFFKSKGLWTFPAEAVSL
jgi:hypothetical protein